MTDGKELRAKRPSAAPLVAMKPAEPASHSKQVVAHPLDQLKRVDPRHLAHPREHRVPKGTWKGRTKEQRQAERAAQVKPPRPRKRTRSINRNPATPSARALSRQRLADGRDHRQRVRQLIAGARKRPEPAEVAPVAKIPTPRSRRPPSYRVAPPLTDVTVERLSSSDIRSAVSLYKVGRKWSVVDLYGPDEIQNLARRCIVVTDIQTNQYPVSKKRDKTKPEPVRQALFAVAFTSEAALVVADMQVRASPAFQKRSRQNITKNPTDAGFTVKVPLRAVFDVSHPIPCFGFARKETPTESGIKLSVDLLDLSHHDAVVVKAKYEKVEDPKGRPVWQLTALFPSVDPVAYQKLASVQLVELKRHPTVPPEAKNWTLRLTRAEQDSLLKEGYELDPALPVELVAMRNIGRSAKPTSGVEIGRDGPKSHSEIQDGGIESLGIPVLDVSNEIEL